MKPTYDNRLMVRDWGVSYRVFSAVLGAFVSFVSCCIVVCFCCLLLCCIDLPGLLVVGLCPEFWFVCFNVMVNLPN